MMTAMQIYEKLNETYGRPRWWSDNPYQVMVQAVLVQNTNWSSVEKVTDIIAEKLLPQCILGLDQDELKNLIRPCGFCKRKAATIRRVTEWYCQYSYKAENVKAKDQNAIRKELLSINGIGAETADVILVYAFHKPSFVIDAYTRRLLSRLGFEFSNDTEIRHFFESGLEKNYQLYGWYHWLILEHGINSCKKTPQCGECAFGDNCNCGNIKV